MTSSQTLGRNPEASGSDVVVEVLQTVLAISWLAINQRVCRYHQRGCSLINCVQLDEKVASEKKRPNRFWHGPKIKELVAVSAATDNHLRMGESVSLRDPNSGFSKSVIPTIHRPKNADPKGPAITVRTMAVKETRTTITVLWQDGTTEKASANDLLHHLNPDEYECWYDNPCLSVRIAYPAAGPATTSC